MKSCDEIIKCIDASQAQVVECYQALDMLRTKLRNMSNSPNLFDNDDIGDTVSKVNKIHNTLKNYMSE